MPSPSLILSVALAASFVPLSNLSRSHSHKARRNQVQPFADALANLSKHMGPRLRHDRVVPEVISDVPSRPVAVFYPYATVLMGNEIHPSALRHVPKFAFEADPDKRYSLIFLGPDYPSRSNPYERNHVLWFVTNYARNATYESRPVCRVSYGVSHLTRNSGRQRFVFLVYEQPDDKDWSQTIMEPPSPNMNFMLDLYVSRNRLKLAAVNYFVVDMEKEASRDSGASDKKSSPAGRVTDSDDESDTTEGEGNDADKASETGTTKGGGRSTSNSDEEITSAPGQHASVGKGNAGGRGLSNKEKPVVSDKSNSSETGGGASQDRDNKEKTSGEHRNANAVEKKSDERKNNLDEKKANGAEDISSKSDEPDMMDLNKSFKGRGRAGPGQDREEKVSSEDKSANTTGKKSVEEKNSNENKSVEVAVNETKTGQFRINSSETVGGSSQDRDNKEKTGTEDKSTGAVDKNTKFDEKKANGAENVSGESDAHVIIHLNKSAEDRGRASPGRDKEGKVSSEDKSTNTTENKPVEKKNSNEKNSVEVAVNETKTGQFRINSSETVRGSSQDRDNKEKTGTEGKSSGAVENQNKFDEKKANGAENMSGKSDERAIIDVNKSAEDGDRASPGREKEGKVSSENKNTNSTEKKSGDENIIEKKSAEVAVNETKTGSGEVRTGIDDTGKRLGDVGEKRSPSGEKDSVPGGTYAETGNPRPSGTGVEKTKDALT